MKTNPELVPLLVVQGAARAIDFYVRALGATIVSRYEHGPKRHVSHADLAVSDVEFAVTEEARSWNSDAPVSLGGSPVVLQLMVGDASAVLASMLDAGATVVFPLQEFLGERMARVRDPFGHLWLLRERVEALSTDEIQAERDALYARVADLAGVAQPEENNRVHEATPRVHLVVGPVGAGKSTLALRLAREHGAVRLTLDEWMSTLFSQDRPNEGVIEWYVERAARSVEQIWNVTRAILAPGTAVVLEIGLIQRSERERFYALVDESGLDLTLHVVDAPRDLRRDRVNERNRAKGETFSMVVPADVFELASDLWEPPDSVELEGRDVRFVTQG